MLWKVVEYCRISQRRTRWQAWHGYQSAGQQGGRASQSRLIEDETFAHEQGCSDESIDVSVQRELTMEQTHAQDDDDCAMEITVHYFCLLHSHGSPGRNDGVDGEVEHGLPL